MCDQIDEIFSQSRQSYGSPRVTKELKARAYEVSRPRVVRLMKAKSLIVRPKRKYVPATTESNHRYRICPNLLDRNFKVGQINRAWVSDPTYLPSLEGWLYLTVIIDLGDRRVIGWAISGNMSTQNSSLPALRMATAFSIHADLNILCFEQLNIGLRSELYALIAIENFRLTMSKLA